ncbi:MAG: porin family protein [Gammaproteobacteria bacterium]|nr:porin family protein [Gammaproteobacteria bacterium]NNF61888.1 outer membrane beta-barrel protein [Gammaproteobacteria bacterium]NNM19644.1 outer membrane beta-barrel protein [Gammaproteobacteria bacterium]
MRLRKILLAFLPMLLASGHVSADVEFYTGLAIGQSDSEARGSDVAARLSSYDVDSVSVDGDDTGWRFYVGLTFTDILAIEFGYADLGDVSTNVAADISPSETAQFATDVANALPVMPAGLTLAGVARFGFADMGATGPLAQKLSVALRLGMIDADSDRDATGASGRDESDASPYYGVSLGMDFNDNWRGSVGYEVFNMDDRAGFWSAGVEYRIPKNQ